MSVALVIVAAGFALAIGLGLYARLGREMGLEQWTVGGRGFGTALVFLLMAGEIYSTFTFLGGAGFAYGSGGPAYYILGYGTLAYVLSYYLLPQAKATHRTGDGRLLQGLKWGASRLIRVSMAHAGWLLLATWVLVGFSVWQLSRLGADAERVTRVPVSA